MANFDFVTWIVIPLWCFTSAAVMEELGDIWSTNLRLLLDINQTWITSSKQISTHKPLQEENNSSDVELILSRTTYFHDFPL